MKSCVLLLSALFLSFVHCIPQKRTLVLFDTWDTNSTHSIFFNDLKVRGHKITFMLADDAKLSLSVFGENLYDNLLLFAPRTQEFGGKINVKSILHFIDTGGNVLVAVDSGIGEALRELGVECGVELDDEMSALIDHVNYDMKDSGEHTLVIAMPEQLLDVPVITGSPVNPVLYRGIGMSVYDNNPLIFNVLHGTPTTYSYKPRESIDAYPAAVGVSAALISIMQARNNARVAFVGSLDFFSNQFFVDPIAHAPTGKRYPHTDNRKLADSLSRWVCQEVGVLRVKNVLHEKLDGLPDTTKEPDSSSDYTIMDIVRYNVRIEELVTTDAYGSQHAWQPFNGTDVQMAFVRIDPFVRKPLLKLPGGDFSLTFKLPDVYGVFKFVVDYNRIGYTHLFSVTQVSVRPLRHTQYERFIEMAYPYYVNAFFMMIGFVLFSFVYVLHRSESKEKKE